MDIRNRTFLNFTPGDDTIEMYKQQNKPTFRSIKSSGTFDYLVFENLTLKIKELFSGFSVF